MEECVKQKNDFESYKGCYLATCAGIAENYQDEVCNSVPLELQRLPEPYN